MSNAIKAKSWLKNIRPAYTLHGGPPMILHFVVKTSETILVGDPLVLDAGQVAEAAADSPLLFGVAAEPSVGVSGDIIAVWVGSRGTVFVAQSDGDMSSDTFPFECDIVADGSHWAVDVASSAEDVLHVIAPVLGDVLSDTTDPPRAYFQIKRSSFDALVAAR